MCTWRCTRPAPTWACADAGYYALDALRIEAGRRAWGAELGPDETPFEAGLGFAVKLDKPGDFIGREALVAALLAAAGLRPAAAQEAGGAASRSCSTPARGRPGLRLGRRGDARRAGRRPGRGRAQLGRLEPARVAGEELAFLRRPGLAPCAVRLAGAAQPHLPARRSMAWPAFEALLLQAFRRDGFEPAAGKPPAGVDFVLERGNRRQFVAARRWKSAHIGVEPLRALQAAREAGDGERVNDALYIGLGEPSEAARQLATAERIAVWRGDEIALALRGLDLKA
jgi:hypothetical protein